MKKKSKRGVLLVVLPIFIFVIYGQIKSYLFENKLSKNGKITIGKIDSIQELPKRSYIYISYYIAGKKYSSFESGQHKNISNKDAGKFYELRYLPETPDIVRGIYTKQITDTVAILAGGFSRQDIK